MDEGDEKLAAAVIVAAGRGTRAGGEIAKQWQPLAGKRVLDWTIEAFRTSPFIGRIVVVVHPDEIDMIGGADILVVPGGNSRAASVRAGLEALAGSAPEAVLIHDGARACVSDRVIEDMTRMVEKYEAVAPGLAVNDALWSDAGDGFHEVTATVDRSHLYRAQTPQAFRFAAILDAHRQHGGDAADDVEVARAVGMSVRIGPGHPDNIKITTPEDFLRAERILKERQTMDIRLGNGFDVHRFGPGDHVTLCGVDIPHSRGLQGHSDADVAMHAVTDAIYGALAEGDIGQHFPPSEAEWKGAASDIFLRHAVERVAARGFTISNLDITIICEQPKIGPHAAAMRARMAEITGLDEGRISVKATTSEKLGFTGRGEGIACIATATLVRQ